MSTTTNNNNNIKEKLTDEILKLYQDYDTQRFKKEYKIKDPDFKINYKIDPDRIQFDKEYAKKTVRVFQRWLLKNSEIALKTREQSKELMELDVFDDSIAKLNAISELMMKLDREEELNDPNTQEIRKYNNTKNNGNFI
ncbi:MAG: hypothetical protein ACR2F1_07955 [Nitrososphaeraceae archaeon]